MPKQQSKDRTAEARFGLLPEPERNTGSMLTSAAVNGLILLTVLYVGTMAHRAIVIQRFERTQLIVPVSEPPKPKVKLPPPPPMPPPPVVPKMEYDAPKIVAPVPPKPEPKPIQMEAKLEAPAIKQAKPNVILAPQPKAALTAAMPAQNSSVKASTAPVHLGQTFGAVPNPNANRAATIAAIGNPYGGMQGPAVAPHGVVGSTGIGNGTRSGSNSGVVGRVASAGIPGAAQGTAGPTGHVGAAGIPQMTQVAVARQVTAAPATTGLEVLSKPSVQYTSEARQLHVQGDVVLKVTFMASGQVVVQGVVRGLGHGLDEEARRVAQQIRFRPATRNGQPVDMTTNITISFQLA
jgi:TonB family protein